MQTPVIPPQKSEPIDASTLLRQEEASAGERPLSGSAKFGLVVRAAFAIALFYLFATASFLFLLIVLGAAMGVFVVLLRFGASRLVTPFVEQHTKLLVLLVRCFWIRKRSNFQVLLEQREAPALFAFLQELSQRLQVPAPRQVRIEMNAGAWVLLKGMRRGADATTLGIGYDLVAALSGREVEAVLAHEMTHAKLVRRGLKHWLNGGVNRAVTLTNGLSAVVVAYRQAHKTHEIGEWMLAGADRCTRLAVRLVATYSRQDEFEADRGAAEICGAAILGSALQKLDLVSAKLNRIGWNERVARLQRGEGFSAWLVEELAVGAGAQQHRSFEVNDRYSTHPTTADRIAALSADSASTDTSGPAIRLFADPDAIAAKLVGEIQRVAQIEEQKDSRLRRRWFKRTQRGASVRPVQWLGVLVLAIAFFIGIFSWADSFSAVVFVAALLLVAAGVAIYRAGRYRDRLPLPVPDFEILKAEWEKPEGSQDRQARETELEAEATKNLAKKAVKERREYLITESYAALEKCDYLRAHVFARLYLQRDQKCVEAKIALAVASAAFRQQAQVASLLSSLLHITGFHSPSTRWGAGWALLLIGDWGSAEAMLEASRRKQPNEPTVAALIALCQRQRNKLHSAIANARITLAAAPQSRVRIELLIDLLLNTGCLTEAEKLLADADAATANDPRLALLMIRLQLLRCDFDCADQWIAKFRQAGIDGRNNVQLGLACETARRDELAASFYSSALVLGYFPEAYLGQARLALHRKQRDVARQHIIAALNVNRPLGERAVGPLQVFAQALQLLLRLEEPIPSARAWIVTVTGNGVSGPLANQSFMIFAANAQQAEMFAKTVFDAVQPDKPTLLPDYVSWKEAPKDQEPAGAVLPGIQWFWGLQGT